MIRKAIPGLEKLIFTEPPKGSVIMVAGDAGTLKSSVAYYLLRSIVKDSKSGFGNYLTLEETRESLHSNLRSIGIKPHSRIKVTDIASFVMEMENWLSKLFGDEELLDLILDSAFHTVITGGDDTSEPISKKKNVGFALDSLTALQSYIEKDNNRLRTRMQLLFHRLRNSETTSIIVKEIGPTPQYYPEYFLVDGIIQLGTIKTSKRGELRRYIQVKKMRATKHDIHPYIMEIDDEGLKIIGKLIE